MAKKKLEGNWVPRLNEDIIFREGVSNLTVLSLSNEDKVYVLDGFAMKAFLLINGKLSLNGIRKKIGLNKRVPAKRFQKDIYAFFNWLCSKKLLAN
jgi:hypothetical protein